MAHVAFESKLRSFKKSSIHLCTENWVAIRRAVVYYGQASHAFSTGIKDWHCTHVCFSYKSSRVTTLHSTAIALVILNYNALNL